ncbi:7256_t:CDS:2, partial [Cetraspora pellucida]
MVGVHGEQKRPIGEIDRFPITVGGKTITSHAVVTEASNYALIVGNDWMRKARARLDWESCELMIRDGNKKIRILTEYCKPAIIGHEISGSEIIAAESKVIAMKNFPRLKDLQTLRRFLGLAELKLRLTSTPILAHPQDDKEFVLYTDASHIALGAVLSQLDDEKREHVV